MLDEEFANHLTAAWHVESGKAKFSEVQQFRALMKSFAALPSQFRVEEFHGMKHQVVFNGEGSWGRSKAQCEISDLLIVAYRTDPRFEARVTLLQAKRSVEKHDGLCKYWPDESAPTSFKANLEQWDLLSRRPYVLPCKPFDCHPEILSGALLPSIGSLGIFHKVKSKNYNFFYLSADIACPKGTPKRKYAKLKVKKVRGSRITNGYVERVFACCISMFAKSLYNLEIGTPIQDESGLVAQDEKYRNMLRGWLKCVLSSHININMGVADSVVARDLIGRLSSEYEQPFMTEPPTILIINSEVDKFHSRQ